MNFDVAEANQLLAAAETRLVWLVGITPSEERQLALEATRSAVLRLRAALGISTEEPARERARHDHEEDEREDWSPRSAYFDDEYNLEGDPHLNGAFG